ncbi:flagellar export protein FliJ [Desulfospira joergensenii]|uniref:flagellar export protein FliJ n=1 Tax=Desulfospira joergensenii TaxID=53329 RepID=UPI0003B30C36|nr:flagellar export protein FliJ [Desulfospira joergensenii]
MKRFDFRLQPLLNYRTYLEQLARQDTAKARMDVMDSKNRIESLKNILAASAGRMEELVEKGVTASFLKQFTNYMDGAAFDMENEIQNKASLEIVLEQKVEILKNKSIEKKSMERLREMRKQEYVQDMMKLEQKSLDEISSLKTAREISDEIE